MARGGMGAKVQPAVVGAPGSRGRGGGGDRRAAGNEPLPYETALAGHARPPTPLMAPRPLAVEAAEEADGPVPRWVVWRGKRRRVVEIEDEWQVDDEWWRDEISRHYFAVRLADGCRLTLFLDRLAGTWWEQRY